MLGNHIVKPRDTVEVLLNTHGRFVLVGLDSEGNGNLYPQNERTADSGVRLYLGHWPCHRLNGLYLGDGAQEIGPLSFPEGSHKLAEVDFTYEHAVRSLKLRRAYMGEGYSAVEHQLLAEFSGLPGFVGGEDICSMITSLENMPLEAFLRIEGTNGHYAVINQDNVAQIRPYENRDVPQLGEDLRVHL